MTIAAKPQPASGYALCTTGRSGSTFLCQLLESTGVLGVPREYFNIAARRQRDEPGYPADPAAQTDWILNKGTSANGIYGVKVFVEHVDGLGKFRWTDRLPGLKFIHLTRDDLVEQAISSLRAGQTGQWRSSDRAAGVPRYDSASILRNLKAVAMKEARWQIFFARNGLAPLRLHYEAVVAAPQATIDQIARFLGIDEPAIIQWDRIELAKQRDAQSNEWRARFIAEMADLNTIDTTDPMRDLARRVKGLVGR